MPDTHYMARPVMKITSYRQFLNSCCFQITLACNLRVQNRNVFALLFAVCYSLSNHPLTISTFRCQKVEWNVDFSWLQQMRNNFSWCHDIIFLLGHLWHFSYLNIFCEFSTNFGLQALERMKYGTYSQWIVCACLICISNNCEGMSVFRLICFLSGTLEI